MSQGLLNLYSLQTLLTLLQDFINLPELVWQIRRGEQYSREVHKSVTTHLLEAPS